MAEEGQRELTPAVWGIRLWWRLGPMDVRQHRPGRPVAPPSCISLTRPGAGSWDQPNTAEGVGEFGATRMESGGSWLD